MPGITVSEEFGICIIACSETVHEMKSTKYLHPPLSPVMTLGSNRRDAFAKVTIVPNLVRTEKVSAFNHSFRVVKLKGTTVGMSCFQLQSNPDNIPVLTSDEENMGSILMTTRPDIRRHMNDIIGTKQCDRFEEQFGHLIANSNLTTKLEDARSHSSFLCEDHLLDYVALELRSELTENNNEDVNINQSTNPVGRSDWILKHLMYPVMSNETFGQKSNLVPQDMTKGVISKNEVHSFIALYELFLNVPELFLSYLQKQYSTRNSNGKQWLQIFRNLKLAEERGVWIASKAKQISLQKLEDEISVNLAVSFEENILIWLEKNCENSFVITDLLDNFTFDNMQKIANDELSYCIIRNSSFAYDSPNWQKLEMANFYPVMALRLNPSDNGIKFVHRWNKSFHWQTDDYGSNTFQTFPPNANLANFFIQSDIIVFKRSSSSFRFLKEEIAKMCHAQDSLKCRKHNENLIPITDSTPAICSFANCLKQPKLKCCNGLERNQCCSTAICLSHANDCNKFVDLPVLIPLVDELVNIPVISEAKQSDVNSKIIRKLAQTFAKRTTKIMTRKNNSVIPGKFGDDSYFSSPERIVGMPGHYLTNTFMRIRSRALKFGKPPVFSQRCLQRMNSTSSTTRSPLLQPEAELFPSQFWYSFESSSIAGALPFTQYKNADKRSRNSFGSVNDHSAIRIRNATLWQSKCPNYRMWAFDIVMNSRSQFYPIQQVMKKGPEILCPNESLDGFAISLVQGVHTFDSGGVDNHRGVNELAAMSRSTGPWRYFYTLTCNDSKTPGVAELYDRLKQLYSGNIEMYASACVSCLPLALMIWERFVYYNLNFIQFSPQKPLGPVIGIIARREFQDDGSLGNKPHIHVGITVDPSEDPAISKERIRAIPSQVFNEDIETNFEGMLRNKWVNNFDEYNSIQSLFSDLHKHDCNGEGRSTKIHFDGKRKDVKCRVPHFPNSLDYDFKAHNNLYSDEILQLMQKYGLAVSPNTSNCASLSDIANDKPIPIDELRGGRVTYPCHKSEQHSPTVPLLFLCSLSSTNVQLCDFRFQMGYLFKYAVGKEHRRETELSVKPGSTAENIVNTGVVNQFNSKSGGQSIFLKNTTPDQWQREIGDAETAFVLLNCCYISSTMRAIHVPTYTPENRAVLMKYKRKVRRNDYGDIDPPSVKLLRNLTDIRQKFTTNQLLTIEDWYISSTALDRVQEFSIRPPILRSFDMLEIYSKCFIASGVASKSNFENPISSPLIDGANRSVKIRICHLKLAINYLQAIENSKFQQIDSFHPKWLLQNIFYPLEREFDQKRKTLKPYSKWFKRFVNIQETTPIAIVFPKIRVEDIRNFLYHLLLINSRFVTELDLVSHSDWRKSFTLGNVMPENPTKSDVSTLITKYVREHLMFQPISTGAFCRSLKQLDISLPEFFLKNEVNYIGQPLVLTRSIKQKFAIDMQEMIKQQQSDLAECLIKHTTVSGNTAVIPSNLPKLNEILEGTALNWVPIVPRKINQSDASYKEQCKSFNIIANGIDNYISSNKSFEPSLLAAGPPGSGKTFLMCLGLLYAMSKGLVAAVFSLTALRARDLAGSNLHQIMKFRDFGITNLTSTTIAETTLLHLQKFPEYRDFLKTADILLCEEQGLISAEQFSAIDKIFRSIRGNPFVPLGGVMFLATGDPQQLPPVKGKPIWLSNILYTTFRILKLSNFVRSAGDFNLQNMLSILQLPRLSENNINDVISILADNLTEDNFVDSIDQIPSFYDVIFAKKDAVADAVRILTNRESESIKRWNNNHLPEEQKITFLSKAVDEFEKSAGDWRKIDNDCDDLKKQICKNMRETTDLFLYEGGVMRITYNGKTNNGTVFSQGQLVVVLSIVLSKTDTDPVVTVALVPNNETNLQHLAVKKHWPQFRMSRRTTEPFTLFLKSGIVRVQRKQFPLVYAAVTTIHKAMGRTCKYVCTKISHIKGGPYYLWQMQLFYVLISRIEYLKNILFVGDKTNCLESIRHILHFRNRTSEYISKLLNHLNVLSCSSNFQEDDNLALLNYKLPEYNVPCVYLIISSQNCNRWKVGQTQNLTNRLLQHNSSQGGSIGTRDTNLQPWIPAAIITGFPGNVIANRNMRLEIEREWHSLINVEPYKSSNEVLYLGEIALSNVKMLNSSNLDFSFLKFNSFLHRS
jgi:hypothetical protein